MPDSDLKTTFYHRVLHVLTPFGPRLPSTYLEDFIFLHGAGERVQVVEASGAFGGAIGLEHRGVARFVEDEAGELRMGQLVESGAPTGEVGDEVAERAAGLASQLVGVEHLGGGGNQRNADSAGEAVDLRHRLVAKAQVEIGRAHV